MTDDQLINFSAIHGGLATVYYSGLGFGSGDLQRAVGTWLVVMILGLLVLVALYLCTNYRIRVERVFPRKRRT